MKNLKEYLFDRRCDNVFLTEAASIIGEEMINEAFKAKILSKLVATVKEYEKEHHEEDVRRQKEYDKKGYGKITPTEKTFASLFLVTFNGCFPNLSQIANSFIVQLLINCFMISHSANHSIPDMLLYF